MADSNPPVGEPATGAQGQDVKVDAKVAKPTKPPNPMWKYMGFGENFRPKLPSRNWMIFLSITGSFTAAVIYDKREKKRAQRKWCKLVEHIAKESIDPKSMPRRLTVFLEGPPQDGLRIAQDHFKDYVKPILVASGLDWEFIQGRKEGDVRAEIAERIRNSRLPPEERINEDPVAEARRRGGVQEFDGPRGDIVIGRHTWKEYVRGVHEGWLGPLTEPPQPIVETPVPAEDSSIPEKETIETLPGITLLSEPREANAEDKPAEDTTEKADDKPKKPPQPKPFITTLEYKIAPTPPEIPAELDPSQPIAFPHILGFLNTPRRLWRFLHRRNLADQIGRDTAAIILSSYRPYHSTSEALPPSSFSDDDADQSPTGMSQEDQNHQVAEQQTALIAEEKEWHKKVRERKDGEPERTWLDPVVLDPRIASRMRRAELTLEDEVRARAIVVPEEEVEGWIKGGIRSLYREGKAYAGFGKERKPILAEGGEESLE